MIEKCGIFLFPLTPTGRRLIPFIFLSFLGFNLHGEETFRFAEYKFSSALTLPKTSTGKEDSLAGSTGLRLSFNDADFRAFTTLPKTSFSQISTANGIHEKLSLFDEARFGAGIFLFQKDFPLNLKVGHNTFSKSISRLRNPSPSVTANPLTKSFAFSIGASPALPTLNSSRQPLSCAFSLSPAEKPFKFHFCLEGFFNEEKESAVCFSAKFPFSKAVFVQSAFCAARLYIENNSSILEKNNAAFNPDFFYSALYEFCFHSPLLKINFYSGIQENPYDVNPFWFKVDGRTAFKSILLNFSYFALPTTKDSPKAAPMITGSSSVCRTVEQASINPQLLFFMGESSLRLGFSALENWKVTATSPAVQLNTAKFRVASEYKNGNFSSRLDWTRANLLIKGNPPASSAIPEEYQSLSVSGSLATQKANFSLSGSYTNYPPKTEKSSIKEVLSMDFKLALPQCSLTGNCGLKLTYKAGSRQSGEFEAGVSYFLSRKYLRSSLKAELILAF